MEDIQEVDDVLIKEFYYIVVYWYSQHAELRV